jgi:EmrB/QacA subfamily drug resistance transporter
MSSLLRPRHSAQPAARSAQSAAGPVGGAGDQVQRPGVPLGAVAAIACVAQFMVVLDTNIVNVALPAMRHALGLSPVAQQWVVTIYLIAFGGLLLLAARASDLLGRRRVFTAGLVVFTGASLAGGLATGPAMLLAARAVQGLGAAALAPASLSLITASHRDRVERGRALSFWAAAAGSAGAAGMVLGGVLTSELSWRWVMFVNVPIGVGLLIATVWLLSPSPSGSSSRLSVPDAVLVTAAPAALVYGISQATDSGWGSARVVAALAAAVALAGVLALVEARSGHPLIPPGIYRHRNLRVANVVCVALGALTTSSIFILSVYEQQLLGYSPLRTGLTLVPWTLVLLFGPFGTQRLLQVLGPVRLIVIGMLCFGAGLAWLAWLAWLPARPDYVGRILGPTLIAAAGNALSVLPSTVVATEGVPPAEAGLASGLQNMSRQIGGALGLAILVTIAATAAGHHGGAAPAAAAVHGYHVALLVAAGIGVVTAAFAGVTLRQPRQMGAKDIGGVLP